MKLLELMEDNWQEDYKQMDDEIKEYLRNHTEKQTTKRFGKRIRELLFRGIWLNTQTDLEVKKLRL